MRPHFPPFFPRPSCYFKEVVGAGSGISVPVKSNLTKYLIRKFYYLKIFEIAKLLIEFLKNKNNNLSSVKSVLVKNEIPFIKIKKNINQKKYINYINDLSPDVIISSNSLIFQKEVLSIPKICCINRHSRLAAVICWFMAYFPCIYK